MKYSVTERPHTNGVAHGVYLSPTVIRLDVPRRHKTLWDYVGDGFFYGLLVIFGMFGLGILGFFVYVLIRIGVVAVRHLGA